MSTRPWTRWRNARLFGRLLAVFVIAALWAAPGGSAKAQVQGELLINGSFEATSLSDQSAWRPLPRGAVDSSLDAEAEAYEGRVSFRVARDAGAPESFVGVAQAIDAVPLRGKTVRFRAAARVAGRPGAASGGLWFRVDREGGGRGFFDNMSDRPIRSAEWAIYEIEGPVAEDATRLTVGFLLNGVGTGWIDAASVEVVEGAPVAATEAAPLTDQQIANLAAFARVYGYVRWFSPYSEPSDARWDQVAAEGAEAVLAAAGPAALAEALRTLFDPWAPGLVIGPDSSAGPGLSAAAVDLVRWRHAGLQLTNRAYVSERISAAEAAAWTAELGQDLFVSMPVTAPGAAIVAAVPPAGSAVRQSPDLRATRLAATIIAWSAIRHFFPYFDDAGEAWEADLGGWLAEAATAPDAEAFGDLLRRMVARLNDGHGEVHPAYRGLSLPLLWRWVEGALVVTAADADSPDVAVGDVVVAIDGRPPEGLIAEREQRVSASTAAHRRWKAGEDLRLRGSSRPVSLRLRGASGGEREVEVTPVASGALEGRLEESRPAAITWLPQGTWYFDLTRLDDRRLREALVRVRSDQSVIFDLRGYPRGVRADFLGHLSDRPVVTPPFLIPVAQLPEARDRDWKEEGWDVKPALPRLRGRVAFLTDERAMSYSETLLAMVQGAGLAEIVGSPTAGSNGNASLLPLPGGYAVQWTGLKVINHDGSDLAGQGVQPTLPVAPTVAGVRQGRDEVLETAIELVTRPAGS